MKVTIEVSLRRSPFSAGPEIRVEAEDIEPDGATIAAIETLAGRLAALTGFAPTLAAETPAEAVGPGEEPVGDSPARRYRETLRSLIKGERVGVGIPRAQARWEALAALESLYEIAVLAETGQRWIRETEEAAR